VDSVPCPYCGEAGDVDVDLGDLDSGEHHFVQDCAVCCRPWAVSIRVAADGTVTIAVDRA
jgi:hypothetical protein